jgi:hypothetical protein
VAKNLKYKLRKTEKQLSEIFKDGPFKHSESLNALSFLYVEMKQVQKIISLLNIDGEIIGNAVMGMEYLDIPDLKEFEKYYLNVKRYCKFLRKGIMKERSPIKQIEKMLLYPHQVCPHLKILSLYDEWVIASLKIYGHLISSNLVSIENKKKIKECALNIFRRIFPDLKGHKEKPDDFSIIANYEFELRRLKNKLKKRYRNIFTKKMDLKDLYLTGGEPFLTVRYKTFVNEHLLDKFKNLSKREIALYLLAYKYNKEPTVIRDWISKAKSNIRNFEKLTKTKILSSRNL